MSDERVQELESRMEEMEVRFAFQERLIAELDGVVRELGDRLGVALDRMKQLEGEIRQAPGAPNTLRDEVPPHY